MSAKTRRYNVPPAGARQLYGQPLPVLECAHLLPALDFLAFTEAPQQKVYTPRKDAEEPYEEWLRSKLAYLSAFGLSPRHHRLWQWFEDLKPGQRPEPIVEIWPRGGAKSTTVEAAVCRTGVRQSRMFALYVCSIQDQADEHVQNIASVLQELGVEPALKKQGTFKGWRRNQLRAANGFNVAAFGLDAASRGVKLDGYRPDLIILDDIDSEEDTPKATAKKKRQITLKVLPTGSPDVAICAIQNLILEDGVFSQLVEGRAGFLATANISEVEPAIRGLETEPIRLPNGRMGDKIVCGVATWEGQSIETCQQKIFDEGLASFLRESQHEVKSADGYFFDSTKFEMVDEMPPLTNLVRAWDLAATQDGGDWTACGLMGLTANKRVGIPDAKRAQLSSENVRALIKQTAREDYKKYGKIKIRLAQDPGQAGKDQAEQLRKMLSDLASEEAIRFEIVIKPVTGPKGIRARGFADATNGGNVLVLKSESNILSPEVKAIAPKMDPHWNPPFKTECRKFREDEEHEFDDQVDWAADAFNELPKFNDLEISKDAAEDFWNREIDAE